MAGWTNRLKYRMLGAYFQNAALVGSGFYLALATNSAPPAPSTDWLNQISELAGSFGYSAGGRFVARDATDFDVLTEDDANQRALVQTKDIVWTANGGTIGSARWAILASDHAVIASRQALAYWDLVSDRSVTDTQALTLQNNELRINEV